MRRLAHAAGIALAILVTGAPGAHAHPLGNFTVNRFSELEVSSRAIVVRYAVDVAEVPTFQEFASIDADRDDAASEAELNRYAKGKASFVADGLRLSIDGAPARLAVEDYAATLNRGQAGLQTLRLDVTLSARLPRASATVEYRDVNFNSLPGWREVVATGVRGEGITSSDVPATSTSDRLRAYPKALLAHPPAVTTARLSVAPDAAAAGAAAPAAGAPSARTVASTRLFGHAFASLIERDLGLGSIAIALLLALGFGALHAIGPGHGKTVMAAYLVGADGKARHAFGLGLAVSLMHTASVIALGVLTLWLTNLFTPAAVYPWLTLASGVVVVGLGAWLFVTRWRARSGAHSHASQPHMSEPHVHPHPVVRSPFSRRGLAAIALSGGLVPSPTAVVVLLGAVALHRIALGVALIVAFSVGLAAALSATGLLVLRARTFAETRWRLGSASLLPALSSATIFFVGCFLTARAALALTAS